MSILLPDGTEHPSGVPDIDKWPEDRRQALYDLAGDIAAIKHFSKWMARLVIAATALATLAYYVIAAKHEWFPVPKG